MSAQAPDTSPAAPAEGPPPTAARPRAATGPVVLLLAIMAAATAVGLVIGGSTYTAPEPGIVDSGAFVGWALPVLRALTLAAGTATFGWLLYAAFLGSQKSGGLLGRTGLDDIRRASAAAGVWAGFSLLTSLFTLSAVLGSPLAEAIRPVVIRRYAWDLPSVRAYLLVCVLAAAIWAAGRYADSLSAAAGWWVLALAGLALPPLSGHAAGFGNHALAQVSGVAHTWAAAAWAGGLLALAVHAWRHEQGVAKATLRYSKVAIIAVGMLALTGVANTWTRMDAVSDLWNSGYGRLVLIKAALLISLVAVAAVLRKRLAPALAERRRNVVALVGLELGVLAVAGGLAVALAQTPYPRAENAPTSVVESLLGRSMPEAPTAANVIFGWQFEPFFLFLGIVGAALYIAAVVRLRGRGDSWPVGRTISWLLGVVAVIWATNSGLAVYSPVSFSIHMFQHMLLSMIAPILLVMGTPITLALRALHSAPDGRRGPREWIVWGINSPVAKFVTHPLWVLFIFTVGLYGLYYTPAFGWLMGSHLGHIAMQVHFLLAGYLFAYVVLGLDPAPRKLPPWLRMVMLLIAMSLHSFFAVPIMMSDTVFAGDWYSQVQPEWITDQVSQTRAAGGVAWAIAEVPGIMLLIALAVQWARSSDREAARFDRQAARDGDAELAAYNERLRRMNESATKRGE